MPLLITVAFLRSKQKSFLVACLREVILFGKNDMMTEFEKVLLTHLVNENEFTILATLLLDEQLTGLFRDEDEYFQVLSWFMENGAPLFYWPFEVFMTDQMTSPRKEKILEMIQEYYPVIINEEEEVVVVRLRENPDVIIQRFDKVIATAGGAPGTEYKRVTNYEKKKIIDEGAAFLSKIKLKTTEEDTSTEGLQEKEIEIVMKEASVDRKKAIQTLKKNGGDVVHSIMDLTM